MERIKYYLDHIDHHLQFDNSNLNLLEVDSRAITTDQNNIQNLLIEGDNLEALYLLKENYKNKVDLIYIDPPYNTSRSRIYKDNFNKGRKNKSYQLFNYLEFLRPRLELARDLLSEEGVIFISIDDKHLPYIRLLCNHLFHINNYLATVVWQRTFVPTPSSKHFSKTVDYLVVFAKNIKSAKRNLLPRSEKQLKRYSNPDNDPRGLWTASSIRGSYITRPDYRYDIVTPGGRVIKLKPAESFKIPHHRFLEYLKDNRIYFGADGNNIPQYKTFLNEAQKGVVPTTLWLHSEVGSSQLASMHFKKLMNYSESGYFDYPKPVDLIKRCVMLYSKPDSIILDFFAGTGTTGHAVLALNREDHGTRSFILVNNNDNKICENITYNRFIALKDKEGYNFNLKYLKVTRSED